MITLLSPAKTLKEDEYKIETSAPIFEKETTHLIAQLKRKSPYDLMELMHISEKLALINMERYKHFKDNDRYPAVYLFRGDVYRGLNIDDFTKEEVKFLNEHIMILSGLYGLLKPLDGIKPYRLEMGTSLENRKGKNLYEYWDDKITKYLSKISDDSVIINLASKEYSKAVKESKKLRIVDIEFLQYKNKKYTQVAFFSKYARGLMAKFIAKNKINTLDKIKEFDYDGYSFNDSKSSDNKLVFTRKYPS